MLIKLGDLIQCFNPTERNFFGASMLLLIGIILYILSDIYNYTSVNHNAWKYQGQFAINHIISTGSDNIPNYVEVSNGNKVNTQNFNLEMILRNHSMINVFSYDLNGKTYYSATRSNYIDTNSGYLFFVASMIFFILGGGIILVLFIPALSI